jgi:glutamine synthetase
MNNEQLTMNANILVDQLKKSPSAFTREDIIQFVKNNNIRLINFMYPGGDGRLKTLNFVVSDLAYLRSILTCGERVDGSSLFDFIQAGSSDLYVVPATPRPSSTLQRDAHAVHALRSSTRTASRWPRHPRTRWPRPYKPSTEATGLDFEAMGELEYYVIKPSEDVFPARDQRAITRVRHTPRWGPSGRSA